MSLKKLSLKRNLFFAALALVGFATAQVASTPTEICPLLIGEKIPSATLLSVDGKPVSTESLFSRPTVLVFYRGGWCPYCNKHLAALGAMETDMLNMGYQLVAVSPDAPEALRSTISKGKLTYQLLSDKEGAFTQAMGLAFKAPANYGDLLKKSSDGGNPGILPVPAVYIVNTKSEVDFMYVNPDYKKRLGEGLLKAALAESAPKK
jgi:peroxiredoxin